MSGFRRIPEATLRELANPAPPGHRHRQMVKIAASLTRAGLRGVEIFHHLRPRYGPDIPDDEIEGIIRWATQAGGPPGRWGSPPLGGRGSPPPLGPVPSPRGPRGPHPTLRGGGATHPSTGHSPVGAVENLLGGFRCDEADLWEASPLRPPEDWRQDAPHLISALFREGEHINIVTDFTRRGDKCCPIGKGETLTREEWLDRLSTGPATESSAGAWIRMNPVDGKGIADANVTAFRFLLLESDQLPLCLQASLFTWVALPVAAIIASGGRSLHAWIKIDASCSSDFHNAASAILQRLTNCGIDPANRNPSRLSRLPGVHRSVAGSDPSRQRLLYLNPEPIPGQPILQ